MSGVPSSGASTVAPGGMFTDISKILGCNAGLGHGCSSPSLVEDQRSATLKVRVSSATGSQNFLDAPT